MEMEQMKLMEIIVLGMFVVAFLIVCISAIVSGALGHKLRSMVLWLLCFAFLVLAVYMALIPVKMMEETFGIEVPSFPYRINITIGRPDSPDLSMSEPNLPPGTE